MNRAKRAERTGHGKGGTHTRDVVLFGYFVSLAAILVSFGTGIIQDYRSGKVICQSIVDIAHMEYDQEFLEEAKQIKGLISIVPVSEIPVRLRAEEYAMNVTLLCTDWSKLQKKLMNSCEVPMGDTPILLLGKDSLAAMTDRYGNGISERKRQEYINHFMDMEWQYSLAAGDAAQGMPEAMASGWKPCRIAGILEYPPEHAYLSHMQADILDEAGEGRPIVKILLTVQGEENHERALGYFGETAQSLKRQDLGGIVQ